MCGSSWAAGSPVRMTGGSHPRASTASRDTPMTMLADGGFDQRGGRSCALHPIVLADAHRAMCHADTMHFRSVCGASTLEPVGVLQRWCMDRRSVSLATTPHVIIRDSPCHHPRQAMRSTQPLMQFMRCGHRWPRTANTSS
ncbi:hypothetical protein MRB53_039685 [Persea americana]|nr:hypothetical protein MRB53_039685 [Persea americana]